MPTGHDLPQHSRNRIAETMRQRANNNTKVSFRNNQIYLIYISMLQRCSNPRSYDYRIHGAKGIKVCDRWLDKDGKGFKNFLQDMGPRPEGKYPRTGFSLYRLSRKDTKDDFCPENCSWSTRTNKLAEKKAIFRVTSTGYLLHPSTESSLASKERERIAWKLSDRFSWVCWYCGISLRYIDAETRRQKRKHGSMIVREIETHLDHIVPKIAGGSDDISNLALCCEFCNRAKHTLHLDFFLEWLDRVKFGNAWIPIRDGRRK